MKLCLYEFFFAELDAENILKEPEQYLYGDEKEPIKLRLWVDPLTLRTVVLVRGEKRFNSESVVKRFFSKYGHVARCERAPESESEMIVEFENPKGEFLEPTLQYFNPHCCRNHSTDT